MPGRGVSRGFTVVELIVVLVLVGMLFALVWPVIMEARETARRTQCRNNLFQIGLALHNDQHAHGVLSPRVCESQRSNAQPGGRVSLRLDGADLADVAADRCLEPL